MTLLVAKLLIGLVSAMGTLGPLGAEPPKDEPNPAVQPAPTEPSTPAENPPPAIGTTRVVQPAEAPKPGEPLKFASAEALLTALETADKGMNTLSADILYDRLLELEGDRQTRKGTLLFRNASVGAEGKPLPRAFAIRFDWMQAGERLEKRANWYVFDGQWLLESWPDEKRFKRRQLVAPGETYDPLKIGEGPLPIPIGQKKDDILARYTAELLDAADGVEDDTQKRLVANGWQLRLIPKDPENDEFREVRLWYRPDAGGRLLPRMARTIVRSGDISTVVLTSVKLDADIPEGTLDTTPPKGFDGEVEEYRRPAGKADKVPAPEAGANPAKAERE